MQVGLLWRVDGDALSLSQQQQKKVDRSVPGKLECMIVEILRFNQISNL